MTALGGNYGMPNPFTSASTRSSHLRLEHERLSQCFLQNCPAVVHGVQEPKQFATQLPILGCHRTAQQPERIFVTRVELLQTVQHNEVRASRAQSLRAQARLRKID
jgi:hypothetical protein